MSRRDPHAFEIQGRVHVIDTQLPDGYNPPSTSMRIPDEITPVDPGSAQECPECFALVRPERMKAHQYWHDQHVEQWHTDPMEA